MKVKIGDTVIVEWATGEHDGVISSIDEGYLYYLEGETTPYFIEDIIRIKQPKLKVGDIYELEDGSIAMVISRNSLGWYVSYYADKGRMPYPLAWREDGTGIEETPDIVRRIDE